MAENPRISISSESIRHFREGDFAALDATLRHEGVKKLVEAGLYTAGSTALGRLALSQVGGGPINDLRLRTNVAGLDMKGPIGLAPGSDKVGKNIQAWQALGARHLSIGGVPFFRQRGRRMPRIYTFDHHIGDHGKTIGMNSIGFSSPDADTVLYNIQKQQEQAKIEIPLIVQITLNKEFYEPDNIDLVHRLVGMTIRKFLPVAHAINLGLTSPNLDGMRASQKRGDEFMSQIFYAARDETQKADRFIPLIYKCDGDGGEERLESYCRWTEYFDGYELINTTSLPHIKARYGIDKDFKCGVSGSDPEYQQMALDAIKYVYEAVGGRIDIIGNGGVDSGKQALKMIEAGASAVGILSSIPKLGLGAMRIIEKELIELIGQKHPDAPSLDRIIGSETKRGPKHLSL